MIASALIAAISDLGSFDDQRGGVHFAAEKVLAGGNYLGQWSYLHKRRTNLITAVSIRTFDLRVLTNFYPVECTLSFFCFMHSAPAPRRWLNHTEDNIKKGRQIRKQYGSVSPALIKLIVSNSHHSLHVLLPCYSRDNLA